MSPEGLDKLTAVTGKRTRYPRERVIQAIVNLRDKAELDWSTIERYAGISIEQLKKLYEEGKTNDKL